MALGCEAPVATVIGDVFAAAPNCASTVFPGTVLGLQFEPTFHALLVVPVQTVCALSETVAKSDPVKTQPAKGNLDRKKPR